MHVQVGVVVQDGCGSMYKMGETVRMYKMGVVVCTSECGSTRWMWQYVQDGCGSTYVQDGCGSIYKMGVVACTRWVWWHVCMYKMGVVACTRWVWWHVQDGCGGMCVCTRWMWWHVQDGCGGMYKMGVVACVYVQDGCGGMYKMGVVAYTHTRQVVHVRDTYCSEVHLLSTCRAGECVYVIRVTHHGMGDRVYCDTVLDSLQTMHMKRRGSSVSLNHSTFVCRTGVGKDGL